MSTATKVTYYVNGVASNIWRRLASSKTFWIAASFVLVAAERWNRGEITGAQFYQIVQIGVIGILIRAAMAKAELAANASNPDVENVHAVEEEKSGISPGPITGIFALLLLSLPFLNGCANTTASGKVCYTDKDGKQVCVGLVEPPPPPPPPPIVQANDMAPAQGPPLTLAKQPLEK